MIDKNVSRKITKLLNIYIKFRNINNFKEEIMKNLKKNKLIKLKKQPLLNINNQQTQH